MHGLMGPLTFPDNFGPQLLWSRAEDRREFVLLPSEQVSNFLPLRPCLDRSHFKRQLP
jgi:hypothetical protein